MCMIHCIENRLLFHFLTSIFLTVVLAGDLTYQACLGTEI